MRWLALIALTGCSLVVGGDDPRSLRLAGLDVEPGFLTPPFSPDVTEYTAMIPVTGTIVVEADAESDLHEVLVDNQVIQQSTMLAVQPGTRTIGVTVRSPIGVSTRYTISATITGLTFEPTVQAPSCCGSPVALANGDFNRDGLHDLAVGCEGALCLMLGNGDGTFDNTAEIGLNAVDVAVGDFDGDTTDDIAVLERQRVTVWRSLGDGTLTRNDVFTANTLTGAIAIGHLNADTHLDLAFVTSASMVAMLGDGTLAFTASALPIDGDPRSISVGEFGVGNGNDLAVGHLDDDAVILYHNVGDGTFSPTGVQLLPFEAPSTLAVLDANADERDDIVLGFATSAGIHFQPNPGVPADQFVELGAKPVAITAAELDGTPPIDVVVATETDLVIVYGIATPIGYPTGAQPSRHDVVVDDFNGDGQLDVATITDATTIGVMLAVKP